jgi:excinuclease UvrABC nuclease subunit
MTVGDLLGVVGLAPAGPMAWADRCPERVPGVYVVECTADLVADGQSLTAGEVLYIGKANPRGGLRTRLRQYSRQTFDKGNHRGGIRVLHIPPDARRVYWAVCPEPRDAERAMIAAFVAHHGRRPFANRVN